MAPLHVPRGFSLAGVYCGIKKDATRLDLTLVVSDGPAVAAGMYTQNLVCAAPVIWDRARTPSSNIRGVVVNSGNANACTGQRGMQDTEAMARLAGEAIGASHEQMLVMSTGVIGVFLPMDRIAAGVRAAAGQLGRQPEHALAAARGILTTDVGEKLAAARVEHDDRTMEVLGMAKGAGMIGPHLATMLGLLLTDAVLSPETAHTVFAQVVERSFNAISVEGHTSTNDTVLLLASGAAGGPPLEGLALARFAAALEEVAVTLAKKIPDDGEGATHLITIDVEGCHSRSDARRIAESIANSALVKTAITGGDPNWGRIVSAAGYAGISFDPSRLELHLNGIQLFQHGAPVQFDRGAASAAIRERREVHIRLNLHSGEAAQRFWTSDLTAEYVRFNSEYTT